MLKSDNSSRNHQCPLIELWMNRGLLWQFTRREFQLRHKGSYLGVLWSILGPLLLLALYVMVFGFIFGGRLKSGAGAESPFEYALALYLGLAIHHFFAEILTISPTCIATNQNLVKKVVFPLSVLPATIIGTATIHFIISLALILLSSLVVGVPIAFNTILWFPVIVLPLMAFVTGISLAFSALGIFWRDILQITPLLSMALLFASAVFYPVIDIPAIAWAFLKYNPLIHWIQESRTVVFWGESPNIKSISYLYAVGCLSMIAGCWIFANLRRKFADVL